MTSLIIDLRGNVEQTTDREFYTRVFGHPPRTQAEKDAEFAAWKAKTDAEHETRRAEQIARIEKLTGKPLSELKQREGWVL